MASNGLAVISGSGGSTIVHKLCADGTVVLGDDKAASVLISGSLCVTGSVKISGSTQVTGSASFLEVIDGQVNDISNHLVSGLSNVSSSTDSPATGSIFVFDGTNWVASGSSNPSNHAFTHIASGSDVINGDRLEIDFVPSVGYIPDSTIPEALSTIELAAHLAGIANAISSAASGGEVNTASNLGTGEGTFAQKVAFDLQFKSLTTGSNIELSSSASEINIALADQISLTAITASFLGDLIGNVTGNVLGDLTGDVTGNVLGDVTGDVVGNLTGNVLGNLTGDVTGNVLGNVIGNLTGNVLGDLIGNVTGQVSDISNHTIGELSNVSSSADSATIGDVLYWDGSAWTTVDSGSVGESNTASNLGSGEGWFSQKVGADLQFKSATSGSNIEISASANEIDIALSNQISLTGVTASFLGDLIGDLTGNVVGNVIGNLTGNVLGDLVGNVTGQVSDISNHTIGDLSNVSSSADSATLGDVLYWDGSAWTTISSGSVGESNTASNLGTGEGLFAQKVGDDLQFRSLQSGSNIELSSSATEVTISLADVISLTSISASAITASNFVGGTFSGLFIGSGSVSGSDHGQLTGLGDDDHLQYLFLNGRAGGQTAIGGTAAGDALVLSASSNAGGGVIEAYHPIRINYAEGNTTPVEQSGIVWEPTFTTTGSYLGQLIRNDADITYTTSFYIYATILDRSFHTSNAAAGFQAFTLFNALPTIRNGTSNDLVQMLVLNDGGVHERRTSGTSTSPQHITVSGAPQLRTSIAGATMTWTAGATGLAWAPKFSTVAGSTVNMGTLAAVSVQAPAAALFQPSAGVENITNIYGLNFLAHTNTVSGEIAVVRSAMTAAASRYFLRNTGGAQSNFGGGNLFNCGFVQILADNTSLSLGAAGGDVQINWNGSALEYDPLSGDDLRWTFGTNAHTLQSSNFGTSSELRMGFDRFAFGQTSAVGNQVGIFVAPARSTSVAGGWSDFLLTQAANLTVNHAMSQVFGWTINAPSMTIGGGGSVTDAGALLVGGNVNSGTNRYGLYILSNPSGGGGVNHSLRVAGSALFDDEIEIDGDLNHDGTNVGFYGTAPVAQSSAYTPSNVATDRSYDANSTTLDEIADVLGTLIADLQATGLIG